MKRLSEEAQSMLIIILMLVLAQLILSISDFISRYAMDK